MKTPEQLESNRKYMARKRAEDPERFKEYNRKWYAANKQTRIEGNKKWRQNNRHKHRAQGRKARTGFTQADWDQKFVAQAGLCAICRVKAAVCADHNHETLQKRGLLCRSCNVALGILESPLRQSFDSYLREWNG